MANTANVGSKLEGDCDSSKGGTPSLSSQSSIPWHHPASCSSDRSVGNGDFDNDKNDSTTLKVPEKTPQESPIVSRNDSNISSAPNDSKEFQQTKVLSTANSMDKSMAYKRQDITNPTTPNFRTLEQHTPHIPNLLNHAPQILTPATDAGTAHTSPSLPFNHTIRSHASSDAETSPQHHTPYYFDIDTSMPVKPRSQPNSETITQTIKKQKVADPVQEIAKSTSPTSMPSLTVESHLKPSMHSSLATETIKKIDQTSRKSEARLFQDTGLNLQQLLSLESEEISVDRKEPKKQSYDSGDTGSKDCNVSGADRRSQGDEGFATQGSESSARLPSLQIKSQSNQVDVEIPQSAQVTGAPIQEHEILESDLAKQREKIGISKDCRLEGKGRDDLIPVDLRNKRMRPTDCLLFAATLLEEDQKQPIARGTSEAEVTSSSLIASGAADSSKKHNASNVESGSGCLTTEPRDVDVLCGRGGLINKHPGNVVYRKVVDFNKPFYQSVQKSHRILVSQSIVQTILNFGGRFLILGAKGKAWIEIGYKRAVQKTSQALRERANNAQGDNDEYVEEGKVPTLSSDTCDGTRS